MEGLDPSAGDLIVSDAVGVVPVRNDWESPIRRSDGPATGAPVAWVPAIPMLHLDGFDGPMDLLLDLAERQRIDLGRMSVLALAEQFVAAMRASATASRSSAARTGWSWRRGWCCCGRGCSSRKPAAAAAAERDAATELGRIDALAELRAAVAWLGARPVLGQDVFTRGAPELLDVHFATEHAVDVIAFLWASLSLFEDDADDLETVARYRPAWTNLYSVTEACDRILRILGEGGDGETLEHFLPKEAATANAGEPLAQSLRGSSAWATTFSASLELAKQGDVALTQVEASECIRVSRTTA